jgi:hypothetical protein
MGISYWSHLKREIRDVSKDQSTQMTGKESLH